MSTNEVWTLINEISKKTGVTEIMINSPENIFIERQGQAIQLNAKISKESIIEFIQEVAKYNQKKCDINNPLLDGKLPDGSRINIILEPFVHGSPAISIRKYTQSVKSFTSTPDAFGLGPRWITFLKSLIKSKMNIVVSGGTGTGKTTLLNLLINEIPKTERIITIEDTLELSVNSPNVVRLESGSRSLASDVNLSIRDLVKNTLRMRPDRIIIGETRGPEIFDLIQAMNTGHDGSLTTIHSNSCVECLSRMETLYLMSGFDMPINAIRRHISQVINFIIQIERDKDGNRVIGEIVEIVGMEGNNILRQTIAKRENGYLIFSGTVPKVVGSLYERSGLPLNFFEEF